MGFFGSIGKFVAYPVVRPLRDAGNAFVAIRGDVRALSERRKLAWAKEVQRRQEAAEHLAELQASGQLDAAVHLVNPEHILDPLKIKDDGVRFEALYQANGWTQPEINKQLKGKRRAKRVGLAICAVSFIWAITVLLASKSVLLPLLLVPAAFMGCVYGMVMSLRYGLHQAQLEDRRLYGMRIYLARPDLMTHLLRG